MALRPVHKTILIAASLAAAAAGAQAPATRVVAGIVRDTSGASLGGSQITLGKAHAVTGADGRFSVAGVPVGSIELSVHRVGYRPFDMDIDVDAASRDSLSVVLMPVPITLAPVTATARPEVFDARLAGFRLRLAAHVGYFLTREQLARKTSTRLLDALRSVPGVHVTTVRGIPGRTVKLGSAPCPPVVFIDGFAATAGAVDLESVDITTLEGVEIYDSPTSTPAELIPPGAMNRCGVIALWSRPARPGVREPP